MDKNVSYKANVNTDNPYIVVTKRPENNSVKSEGKLLLKVVIVSFLTAVLACCLVLALNKSFGNSGGIVLGGSGSDITQPDTSDTLAEAVANKCLPNVVSINVYSAKNNRSAEQLTSMGSGVIMSEDGYVITNQHVVNGAKTLKVKANGQEYSADKIGEDSSSDIAIIKIRDASGLKAIELGDSDNIKVGEWVMALGSPFGLEQSVSTGIVSATSRSEVVSSEAGDTKVYTNLIQTDAAINPGNSGGALVDKNGRLIGINALIASSSGNSSGVGFAIPVNYAINLSKQIIEGKTPSHAKLGVTLNDVNTSTQQQYNLSISEGALVVGVTPGSSAGNAGIKVGDIITKVDDNKVSSTSDVLLAVRSHNPGDTISIEINRNGNVMKVDAILVSE